MFDEVEVGDRLARTLDLATDLELDRLQPQTLNRIAWKSPQDHVAESRHRNLELRRRARRL